MSVITRCPYQAGVRKAGFYYTSCLYQGKGKSCPDFFFAAKLLTLTSSSITSIPWSTSTGIGAVSIYTIGVFIAGTSIFRALIDI